MDTSKEMEHDGSSGKELSKPSLQESTQQKCDTTKKDSRDTQMCILQLVEKDNPILHERIEDMTIAEILSDEIKATVQNMIFSIRPEQLKSASAPYEKAAGMAANQWNIRKRIFLFSPNGSDGSIKVIFNPTYSSCVTPNMHNEDLTLEMSERLTDFHREACFSVPDCFGIVERYREIAVTYFDENGEFHMNEHLSGWEARVWQHETDHLNGILYCNRNLGFDAGPNCVEFYRDNKSSGIENHH